MDSFYSCLKDNIESYPGSVEGHILYIPKIYLLLSSLAMDPEMNLSERRAILTALGYFVLPNDLLPEDRHGPSGFMDDLFLCCYTLDQIAKNHGIEILERYWEGEEPIASVVSYCLIKTESDMGVLAQQVLDFSGLALLFP